MITDIEQAQKLLNGVYKKLSDDESEIAIEFPRIVAQLEELKEKILQQYD